MNASEKTQSLRPALLAWQVSPPTNPAFRTSVWGRIESVRQWVDLTWSGYLRRHLLAWGLVLAMTAVGAGWMGHRTGAKHAAADREAVLASYVAAIDARAMMP